MDKYYMVMSPNGYPLGEGKTKKEAWENSYGPKPWTSWTKKSARGAWIEETTPGDAERITGEAHAPGTVIRLTGFYDEEEVPGEHRFN
tara:strand:- start:441 stop:704 length:264 start_codon:yes stop_codon:yes gene_type:complete